MRDCEEAAFLSWMSQVRDTNRICSRLKLSDSFKVCREVEMKQMDEVGMKTFNDSRARRQNGRAASERFRILTRYQPAQIHSFKQIRGLGRSGALGLETGLQFLYKLFQGDPRCSIFQDGWRTV